VGREQHLDGARLPERGGWWGVSDVLVSRRWQLPISPTHGAAASRQSQHANSVQGCPTEHRFSVTSGDSISLAGSMLLVPRCAIVVVPPSSPPLFPFHCLCVRPNQSSLPQAHVTSIVIYRSHSALNRS
jgi:hypothetical protein